MPTPEEILSPDELAYYKRVSARSASAAAYYLDAITKEKGLYRPSTQVKPTPVQPVSVGAKAPTEPTSYSAEDIPVSDEPFISSGYETESERLKREAAKIQQDIYNDRFISTPPSEEEGLPPVTAEGVAKQERYVPASATTVKAAPVGTPIVQKAPEDITGITVAAPINEYKAKLTDEERKAYDIFYQQMVDQGSTTAEAQSRAQQLTNAIVRIPRDFSDYSAIQEADTTVDPEKYASGEYGFAQAIERKPLESAGALKIRKSREARTAELNAQIDDEVNRELAGWAFLDEAQRVKARDDIKKKKIAEHRQAIESEVTSILLMNARATGQEIKPGEAEFITIQDQSKAIADLWEEELRGAPAKPETGALQSSLEYVMTDTAPNGQLMESSTGAFMRSLGGAWRFVTQPLIRSMTYDVKPDGTPVDPTDLNYKLNNLYSSEIEGITSLTGRSDIGIAAAQFLGTIGTLGTGPLAGSARQVGSGITKKTELSSGNYLNDVAYGIAVGRSLGDDFSDLPAAQYFYGQDSMIPFYAGLGVEVALPINPLEPISALVGGAKVDFNIARLGMASSKLTGDLSLAGAASRLGLEGTAEVLTRAGEKIASPISSGLNPMIGEMYRTSQAAKIAEIVGAPKPSMIRAITGTKPVAEYVAETLAPAITNHLNELEAAGKAIPQELAELNLLKMTARDMIGLAGTLDIQKLTGLANRWSETSMGKIITGALISESKSLVEAAQLAEANGIALRQEIKDLISEYEVVSSSVTSTGKISNKELQNLIQSYATFLDTLEPTGKLSNLEDLTNTVSNTVIRGRLLEDLAKTDYNNWLFISPTAIVKTTTWERLGSKIDASVKSAIWGSEDATKAVSNGMVTVPEAGKAALLDALQSELGPAKVARAKYWSELADKLKSTSGINLPREGEALTFADTALTIRETSRLTIDEFNDAVDLLRTKIARETLKGGEVINPASASKLTERAAVPLNRRIPLARLTEDMLRIPIQKISNMDLAAAISRVGKAFKEGRLSSAIEKIASGTDLAQKGISRGASAVKSIFTNKTINEIIEGSKAPLPIVNLVKQYQVKVNGLLGEFTEEMRALIKGGMSGTEALNEKIITELFGEAIVEGTTTVDKLKPIYRDLLTRFFGISASAEDIARTIDTVINDVLKPLGDENGIIDAAIFSTRKRSFSIDILDKMVEGAKENTSFLKPRGLANLFGQKAYTELIVAKILDQRLTGIIDNFGSELIAKYPDLVIGASKVEDVSDISKVLTEHIASINIEDDLKALVLDPTNVGLQQRVSNKLVDLVSSNKNIEALSKSELNPAIRQIYFNVINDILKDGIADTALLSEKARVILREKLYGPVRSINNVTGRMEFTPEFISTFTNEMNATGSRLLRRIPGGSKIDLTTILNNATIAPRMEVMVGATVEDILQLRVQDIIAKLDTLGFKFSTESKGFEALNYTVRDLNSYIGFFDPETASLIKKLEEQNRFWQEAVSELSLKNKSTAAWWEGSVRGILQTARRNLFGGMLGGIWTMNSRFLGPNNFTAPLIAAVTNPGYFITTLKVVPGSFVKPFVKASETAYAPLSAGVGSAIAGAAIGSGMGGLPGAAMGAIAGGIGGAGLAKIAASESIIGRGFRGAAEWLSTPTVRDVIVTETGKVYDKAALRKIYERNVYAMSQGQFNVSAGVVQDMMRALEVNSEGYSPILVEKIRRSIGPFSRNTSYWNDVGSQADFVFREAVFQEALRRGAQETEAATLARNTLLDYAAIPDAERKLIASWNMFYSFSRQMAVESVMALGRPGAQNLFFKSVMINKKLEEEFLNRNGNFTPQYSDGRAFTGAGDRVYDGYRTAFYGPGLPQLQSLLGLYGGLFTIYDAYNKGRLIGLGSAAFYGAITSTPGGEFTQGMSEVLSDREDAAHGMFPASMIVNTTQVLGYDKWDWVKERYYLEPVKDADGNAKIIAKGEPTWGGYQWRFGNEQGKYNFLIDQMIAQQLGFQRTLNDWAAVSAKAAGVDPTGTELKRGKDGIWYLYAAGLQTPLKAPDWITAQDNASRQIISELQSLKSGKSIPYTMKGAELGKPTREAGSVRNIIISPFEKQKMLDELTIKYQREGMSRDAAIARARQDVAQKEMDISRGK